MKRTLALLLALVICVPSLAFAGSPNTSTATSTTDMTVEGTVTKLDKGGRMMVVKLADGTEATIWYKASTKFEGDAIVGSSVAVKGTKENDKMMATSVTVKAKK